MKFYFLSKPPITTLTNSDMLQAINKVKQAKNQQQALDIAYELVGQRFQSYRFRTYWQLIHIFLNDPNELWQRTSFLHCHHQNFLLRILLIRSNWFTEDEIALGFGLVFYVSPHQYLKVKVDNRWIAVDPWNYTYGAKLGEYANGFGFASL